VLTSHHFLAPYGSMNRPFLHLIFIFLAIACLACSGLETNLQDVEVSYRETARQNYDAGDRAFKTKQFNQAVKFFEHVKNKFPYSKYAVLADLRVVTTSSNVIPTMKMLKKR